MGRNFLVTLFVLIGLSVCSLGLRQEESLNLVDKDLFIFGFEPDFDKKEITFDVTVKTLGYIGFGIAPKASMIKADIMIGGVRDGVPYIQDYHGGSENAWPTLDESQDWTLIDAKENETHTYMKFKRLFDTCDKDDMAITDDTLNVIWSIGETDNLDKHIEKGGRQFLLLDPPLPVDDLSQFVKWEIRVNDTVPHMRTSYLCSFHKLMRFDSKHHIVGVEAFLENQAAITHTHHFTVTTCRLPNQEMMEDLLEKPGEDCFGELLWIRPYCNEVLFGWAVGGKRIMLPEHVGVPVGDDDVDRNQYIMLEVHYENPKVEAGVTYITGFDTYYTSKLRKYEGSLIMIGQEVNPSLLIPPQAPNFVIAGHCSSDVTKAYLPPEGVKVIGVNLHSHIAGRKMRLRHFRKGVELPWLINDDNYDFDYQQTRLLKKEIDFLPGDHLTNECVFDTMDRNVVTLAGESTTEEMCHSYILYYPRIELRGCKSYYPLPILFKKFGIQEVDKESSSLFDPTVTKPLSMAGKNFSTILNEIDWTLELKDNLQNLLRQSSHVNSYTVGNHEVIPNITARIHPWTKSDPWQVKQADEDDGVPPFTRYPAAAGYKTPETECNSRQGQGSSADSIVSSVSVLISTTFLIIFNLWN